MWNRELYIVMIREIVERRAFMGKPVKNKEEIHRCISSLLYRKISKLAGCRILPVVHYSNIERLHLIESKGKSK